MTLTATLTSRLDPVYAAWLDASNPPLPEGFQPTVEQMRQGFAQQVAVSNEPVNTSLERVDMRIEGRDGHVISVRLYQPAERSTNNGCCVYVHGGGWVLGNLDTHDGICVDLALHTGRCVVAIDYRLSPEHRFPAALHDTIDVLQALNRDPSAFDMGAGTVSLIGDSAGTSLAVSACLSLRGHAALPDRLVMFYPALGADIDRPSFIENREVPGLTPDLMRFFFMSYIGGETLPDPLAAPLTVEDFHGLPPAFISAAELDPLRDDATDFAARLQATGRQVQLRIEAGLGHGFLWVRRQSPAAGRAFTAAVEYLSADTR